MVVFSGGEWLVSVVVVVGVVIAVDCSGYSCFGVCWNLLNCAIELHVSQCREQPCELN